MTCSTLLKELLLLSIVAVFLHPSTPSKYGIVQHIPCRCPCRFVILATKLCIITSFETDIKYSLPGIDTTHRKYKIPGARIRTYIRSILMRVASVGCFPGAWRRGSWHFQVASLHLQSSMDLLLNRFTLFFLREQA